jgi:hypothetical protein
MTRQILTLMFSTGLLLAACGGAKFHASVTEDKPLFAAINELHKHPDNAKAQNDLKALYEQAVARHEEAIEVYRNSTDDKRWDKIINELNALQNMYTSLQATPGTFNIVKSKNYLQDLQDVREAAAESFYAAGQDLMKQEGRENGLQAYALFKNANRYVSGYKDVQRLMKDAYEMGIVYVVINPVENDNIFFTNYASTGFGYRAQDYQESLVRELGGRNANIVPARFYTNLDADRENIDPDRVVDIRWRSIDASPVIPYKFTRQVSKSIQNGKDTSGKSIYKTVYATLHITQRTYNVNGGVDYLVSDVVNNRRVDQGLLTNSVSWTESWATYTGDSRALSQDDWYIVNNRNNFGPTKETVLNTLMRKIYPDLRYRIQQSVYE